MSLFASNHLDLPSHLNCSWSSSPTSSTTSTLQVSVTTCERRHLDCHRRPGINYLEKAARRARCLEIKNLEVCLPFASPPSFFLTSSLGPHFCQLNHNPHDLLTSFYTYPSGCLNGSRTPPTSLGSSLKSSSLYLATEPTDNCLLGE